MIGKKLGMTQIFHEDGGVVPVTVIEAGPCTVVQIKTPLKEKYGALQVGFQERDMKRVKKPLQGHFTKAQTSAFRHLREFEISDVSPYQVGQVINVEEFKVGDLVDVTGISKGKGFMGVVKPRGFAGGPAYPWLHVSPSSRIHWGEFIPLSGLAGAENGGTYRKPKGYSAKS
jgi:large subunit ribosomal protein L3